MKTSLFYALPLCLAVLFVGCKKKTDIDYIFPEKGKETLNLYKDDLRALLKSTAAQAETFRIDAEKGGKFITSKGNTYTVAPDIFLTASGNSVSGLVDIIVMEITKPSEMILNDKPTNAVVDNKKDSSKVGAMLNSFGEFRIDAKQGQDNLQLKPNAKIGVVVPQPVLPPQELATKEIPLWSGDTIVQKSLKGYGFENQEIFTQTEIPEQIGIVWTQSYQNAIVQETVVNNVTVPSVNFEIPNLGNWSNCDRLISVSRLTTVIGYFTNVFNDSSTADRFGGYQANMLFFKKKGDNTLIKLYDHIVDAPEGKEGFLSYQNTFGIGMEGTFLALVSKGGTYYAQKKGIIIAEPETGKNYVAISFTLDEVTKDEMLALIDSMNNE